MPGLAMPTKIEEVANFLEKYVIIARHLGELDRLDRCLAAEQMDFSHLSLNKMIRDLARKAVTAAADDLREENFGNSKSRHRLGLALARLRFETR